MTISEESRHRLYGRLEEVLGEEQAATLMQHLPPVGWADVATRRDLEHFAIELRAEMASFDVGLRVEILKLGSDLRAELRSEIGALGSGLRAESGSLGSELRSEIATLGSELRGEMGRMRTDFRTLFLGLVGLQFSGAAVAVAVSRLL